VDAAAAALAATASGAYAGVDAPTLQQYGAGLLAEWLAPARLAALHKALGIALDDAGENIRKAFSATHESLGAVPPLKPCAFAARPRALSIVLDDACVI